MNQDFNKGLKCTVHGDGQRMYCACKHVVDGIPIDYLKHPTSTELEGLGYMVCADCVDTNNKKDVVLICEGCGLDIQKPKLDCYADPVKFIAGLKDGGCRHSTDMLGRASHDMSFKLRKDFTSVGLDTSGVPETFQCCYKCGADYMNSFNAAWGRGSSENWTVQSIKEFISSVSCATFGGPAEGLDAARKGEDVHSGFARGPEWVN